MKDIYLFRHGQAHANRRDFAAFGNEDSPLTDHGIAQILLGSYAHEVKTGFRAKEYAKSVAASGYTRAQYSARVFGFRGIDVLRLINESNVDEEIISGADVIAKHRKELWVPPETQDRVDELYEEIESRRFSYEYYFTHGMFMAGFVLSGLTRGIDVRIPFDEQRGFIALQAAGIKAEIEGSSIKVLTLA